MSIVKKLTAILILTCATQNAAAEVYSCGPGCYTSKPSGSRVQLGNKIGSYTAMAVPRRTETASAPSAANPARTQTASRPNNAARNVTVAHSAPAVPAVPKLNAAKASGRRTILEQELNNERNALANAQKALAEGRAISGALDGNHQARIRQLESAVLDRQQNIQALQRELARM